MTDAEKIASLTAHNERLQNVIADQRAMIRLLKESRIYPAALGAFAKQCMDEITRLRERYEPERPTDEARKDEARR